MTELLQGFDGIDMEDREGAEEPPSPTEQEVAKALRDGEEIEETPGGLGTPVIGEEVPVGSVLLGGGPWGTRWVPAVLPDSSDELELPPPPLEYTGAPAHPILSRLFGRNK